MHTPVASREASLSSKAQSQKTAYEAQKRITVTVQDLTVNVSGVGEDFGETILSVVDLSRIASLFGKKKHSQRSILKDVTVQVRPGEMCMVLGRPGSGCTSLLKIMANETKSFPSIEGVVKFGGVGPEEAREFRHQTLFNSEEDIHFPTLTVSEAIQFAAATKVPGIRPEELEQRQRYIEHIEDSILSALAISHTKDTLVGNEFVRGVSGGERKRVSIAEVLAGSSPLQCWDQSTRGLDASTALEFVRVLRRSADEQAKSIVATLYQAGNGIFNQFDKVVVLCEGREIYYGPTSLARGYFEDMGFICSPGANVADFLTSVAVPTERAVRKGFEDQVPVRPEDFEARYKNSAICGEMLRDISTTNEQELLTETQDLRAAVSAEKSRSLPMFSTASSPYTVSLYRQTMACTKRQFQIIWGDRWSNVLKIASSLIQALVCGSLFYNLPGDSGSIFTRPGALFFPILYYALCSLSETTASFMGRPILARHKEFGFYRPTAFTFACVISDIPIALLNITLFDIVFYFMANFQHDAGKWFTNWIILVVITLCFTSFFRMIGAACKRFGLASQVSGWTLMIMMIYAGYLIPFESMHVWFRWISYLNPAYHAFESVMGSEFGNRVMECVEPQFIPYGESYTNDAYKSCTVTGTAAGSNMINGQSYISTQYQYSEHHVWRGFGIICAFWLFFACMTAVGFEAAESGTQASRIIFERGSRKHHDPNANDEEKAVATTPPSDPDNAAQGEIHGLAEQSMFTFKDLDYHVNYHGADKQLLQGVNGFVKPGQLVALMGTSGAGKTTLMDVLAQRKDSGRIEGSILVDGKPQSISFQRTTGYCEQNDVHESTGTVRESLLFSARLRQKFEVPDSEKVEYVEKIMDLLELTEIQDALVGSPGAGLSIEQRKRLTLAVELVTKPSLLFLDEPTSGLDGQSAFNIVRFMRRLAQAGQSIVCTIHQPSASLFEAFDVLLLLIKGGRTTYFGETGKESAILLDYFARNGAPCPPDTNPAEHIIDAVQGKAGNPVDWAQTWLESNERQQSLVELDRINASCEKAGPHEDVADTLSFATPKWFQIKLVTKRQVVALWRNPDYIWNKILLHLFASLFAGFTFWMIGDGSFDLQLRLFAIFNFVFVAPGVINQLQPLFLHNRDIFETREKKSKTYHWLAFISAQLISEIPVLIVCGTLYFACWYFTAGMPVKASASGQVYLQMLLYEFLYTAIGQAIAAYSPNEYFAALANPIVIGAGLINFCGIVVPYSQIQPFWRYWMYYLDPFTYLVGGLLEPILWDVNVKCKSSELTSIPLPSSTTCGAYMADFLASHTGYVVDPASESSCEYCEYSSGADYAKTINLNERYYGWRDVGITALFCCSSYALVFLMMKLRSKKTKTAG